MIPNVTGNDWKEWANRLGKHLRGDEDTGGKFNTPRPVLLSHSTSAVSNIGIERAFIDGVLLFDPDIGMILVSSNGKWEPIFTASQVAALFSVAAYGAMFLSAPPTAGFDIDATFQKITFFTDLRFANRGVTLDPIDDTFVFEYEGVYRISINLTFTYDDLNQGRITNFNIRNETLSTTGNLTPIGIARNVGVTNFNASFLVSIQLSNIGDVFSVEIGGEDDVFNVSWEACAIDINMISEWRGLT